MTQKLIVIGASALAESVIDAVELGGKFAVIGLIDNFKPVGTECFGHPVLGALTAEIVADLQRRGVSSALIAVGHNSVRKQLADDLLAVWPDVNFATVVHPSAILSRGIKIGCGTVILPHAVVRVNASVGNHCLINTKASLDHDSVMEDFSSLAPGSTVCGYVHIGEGAAVCAGATIINNRRIGAHTVIGAGSTVVCDIESLVVAYGNPARVIRVRKIMDGYM